MKRPALQSVAVESSPPLSTISGQARSSASPSWMQGLPPPIMDFIGVAGIESDGDMSEYFADLAEIAEEAEQRQWPTTAREALVLAWREARHREKKEAKREKKRRRS